MVCWFNLCIDVVLGLFWYIGWFPAICCLFWYCGLLLICCLLFAIWVYGLLSVFSFRVYWCCFVYVVMRLLVVWLVGVGVCCFALVLCSIDLVLVC